MVTTTATAAAAAAAIRVRVTNDGSGVGSRLLAPCQQSRFQGTAQAGGNRCRFSRYRCHVTLGPQQVVQRGLGLPRRRRRRGTTPTAAATTTVTAVATAAALPQSVRGFGDLCRQRSDLASQLLYVRYCSSSGDSSSGRWRRWHRLPLLDLLRGLRRQRVWQGCGLGCRRRCCRSGVAAKLADQDGAPQQAGPQGVFAVEAGLHGLLQLADGALGVLQVGGPRGVTDALRLLRRWTGRQ